MRGVASPILSSIKGAALHRSPQSSLSSRRVKSLKIIRRMSSIECLPEEMIQAIMDYLTVTSFKSLFDVSQRMRASVIDYITHCPDAILRFD